MAVSISKSKFSSSYKLSQRCYQLTRNCSLHFHTGKSMNYLLSFQKGCVRVPIHLICRNYNIKYSCVLKHFEEQIITYVINRLIFILYKAIDLDQFCGMININLFSNSNLLTRIDMTHARTYNSLVFSTDYLTKCS